VHVAIVCSICFGRFIRMLQVFCVDVGKVNPDVSMLRGVATCFQMLQMLFQNVADVVFECCVIFLHVTRNMTQCCVNFFMLQATCLNVATEFFSFK
jgi:hypothetical protein